MNLGQLNPAHVGKEVTVYDGSSVVTGLLTGFTVEARTIHERQLIDDRDHVVVVGPALVTLRLGTGWVLPGLPLDARVEVA